MHIHPISIQVPSVTSVATGCIFLTALIILGMLGLVGDILPITETGRD